MFTLVIYLVVVALSGAAVLHITLADQSKRATPRSRTAGAPDPASRPASSDVSVPGAPPTTASEAPAVSESEAESERKAEAAPGTEPDVRPTEDRPTEDRPSGDPVTQAGRIPLAAAVVIEAHRARSAGLLMLLLTVLGGVLALVVAVTAVAAAVALRSALV